MKKKTETKESENKKINKKPYESPKLKKHGAISDLKRLVI